MVYMNKLRLISSAALLITIVLFIMSRISTSFPDWAIRANGIVMIAALAAIIFSTVRIATSKK